MRHYQSTQLIADGGEIRLIQVVDPKIGQRMERERRSRARILGAKVFLL